jgi:hypothetical protein
MLACLNVGAGFMRKIYGANYKGRSECSDGDLGRINGPDCLRMQYGYFDYQIEHSSTVQL